MIHSPFQRLCCIQPVGDQQPFLLAASGPCISSFDLRDGSLLSQWSPSAEEDRDHGGTTTNGEGPPTKRRKIEADVPEEVPREESDESVEIISERKKGERRKPKVENSTLPNVSHIVTTSNGKTVICVTGEDKTVTVLEVQSGVLSMKTRR